MSTTQLQLGGGEAESRNRPDTFVVCAETGEFILRSRRHDWPHATLSLSEWFEDAADAEADDTSPYDEYDADDEVGGWYDVTIEVNVTYRFRIPAFSDHRAKELAEEWRWDATPSDSFTMHTDRRKIGSVERQDLPVDWDPYGGEPIHEALDCVEDGEDDD